MREKLCSQTFHKTTDKLKQYHKWKKTPHQNNKRPEQNKNPTNSPKKCRQKNTAWRGTPDPHSQKVSCKEMNLVTFSGMPNLCLTPSDAVHWRMVLHLACCEYLETSYISQKTSIKDCKSGNNILYINKKLCLRQYIYIYITHILMFS